MATARTRSKAARKRPPEQGRKHAAFARSRAHILASTVELMAQVGPSATVEQVAAHAASHTGQYLRPLLEADGAADAPHVSPPQDSTRQDRVTARD